MNNNDLLHTNNLEEQYNIINPKLELTETQETIRENTKINNTIPNNIYPNKLYDKNINIKSANDLLETNKFTTEIDKTIKNDFNEKVYNEERYNKIKKTKISIYSEDRNLELSIIPNNFDMELNKTYKNIQKIILTNIYFPNSIPILNEFNNRFTWEYPSTSDSKDIFIPGIQPRVSEDIYTGDVPWSNILTESNKNVLLYSTKINIISSDTKEFETEFNRQISNNLFNEINLFDLKNCIDIKYNSNDVISRNISNLLFNQEIFGSKNGTGNIFSHRNIIFDVDINEKTNIVKMVNRIEKVPIYAIQIFNRKDNIDNDIFYKYSNIQPINQITRNYIYIVIKYDDFHFFGNNYFNDISGNVDLSNNIFPFVITNINFNIGNVKPDMINYTPFYYFNLFNTIGTNTTNYQIVDGNANNSISYYSFNDLITFTDICGNETKFVRLRLSLSNGNKNGLYFDYFNGIKVYTTEERTIITSSWLKNFLNNYTNSANNYLTPQEINNIPYIGRALPTRLIKNTNLNNENDNKNNENNYLNNSNNRNKINSVLDLLGWTNKNKCRNGQNVSLKEKFYFVHSNIDSFRKNIYTKLDYLKKNPQNMFKYISPQRKLNLELINNKYYFKSIPFIFVKIIPYSDNIVIDNQLVRSYYKSNTINNQEYKKEIWNNIEKYNKEYLKSDSDNIIAKIYLKSPYNTTIITDINKEYIFYNKPLDTLQKIKIIITDPYGRIIDIQNDFSLTIELQEQIGVLKNTLFDTKRGDIVTNGIV